MSDIDWEQLLNTYADGMMHSQDEETRAIARSSWQFIVEMLKDKKYKFKEKEPDFLEENEFLV